MLIGNALKIVVSGIPIHETVNETMVVSKEIFHPVDASMSRIFAKALGFTALELFLPIDGQFGRSLPDGNWTGMIGMIQRQEVDLAISIMTLTEERNKVVHLSYPFSNSDTTFVTFKPSYSPHVASFLFPFSIEVWIYLAVSLLVVPFLFFGFHRGRYSLPMLFLNALGPFLHQKCEVQSVKPGDHLLLVTWVVAMTLLSQIYTAVVFSVMFSPTLSGVRTIRELSKAVEDGPYECTTYPGGFMTDSMLRSRDPLLKVIGQCLQKTTGTNDIEYALEHPSGGNIPVFIGALFHFESLRSRYFVSKDAFYSSNVAIAVRKDFCCKAKLDRIVHRFWAAGLYDKLLADHSYVKSLKMNSEIRDTSKQRQLTMSDFHGPFLFLIVLHALAIFVHAVEIIAGNFRNDKVSRIRQRGQLGASYRVTTPERVIDTLKVCA